MSQYKPGQWTLNGKPTNAHLLDAAQDLYDALDAMLNGVYHYHMTGDEIAGNCGECKTATRARAALAKARGEK